MGNATAQFGIGSIIDLGLRPKIDAHAAARWFRAAASQRQLNAQHRIATDFEEGKAVPQDMAQAALCYGHSATQVNIKRARDLGNLYLERRGMKRDFVHVTGLFRYTTNGEKTLKPIKTMAWKEYNC